MKIHPITTLLIAIIFYTNTFPIHAQCPATIPTAAIPTEPNCPLKVFEVQRPAAFNIDQTVTTQVWTPTTNPPSCCFPVLGVTVNYNAPTGPFSAFDVNGLPMHQAGTGTFVTINSVGVTDGNCGGTPNSNPDYLGGDTEQVQQDGWLIIPQGVVCIRFQLQSPACNRFDAAGLWLGNSITSMVQVGQKKDTDGIVHDYIIPPNAVDICGFKVLRLRYYSYDPSAFSNTILSWDIGDGNGFVDVTNTLIQSMGPNQNPDSDDNMPTADNLVYETVKTLRDVDGEYFIYDANADTYTGILLDPFDIDTDDEGAVDACIVATELSPNCADYLACTGGLCQTLPMVDIVPTACNYQVNQTIDATPNNAPSYITNYTYLWSSGQTTATINPTLSGLYTVMVTANYDWHDDDIIDLQCETVVSTDVYDAITLTDNTTRCSAANTIDVTVAGGQPAFYNSLSDYSFSSNLDGFLGNATTSGLMIFNNASCGTHTITVSYDYLDPYNNFVNTGENCTQTITVEVYDTLDLQSESSICGAIDILNIIGGWDTNCVDFATPANGYTISIVGPNNSALTSASNYTIGPITSFAGVEFMAGQNGVPLNGLAGGNYTITVNDGRNLNCLESFTIDILGCCPASTDANTSYELCGLNTPSFQPSNGSTLPNTTVTFGDLPDLTINNSATNLMINTDTELSLNLDDLGNGQDIAGDGVDWFLGNNPLTATPYTNAAMISDGICNAQTYTIYAFLRCDGDHNGIFNPLQIGNNTGQTIGFDAMGVDTYIPAGQVIARVWPEIAIPNISYPNLPVECQINLINPCPDIYELEVTDEDGNNYTTTNTSTGQMIFLGPGNQYTYDGLAMPNSGTIGDLTLNITNPLAIAAFGNGNNADSDNVTCSSITFERPYLCCLAESGSIQAGLICPDSSTIHTALNLDIGSFRGDPIISPQLPNYCTYLLIVEKNTNNICGVIPVACTDNIGFLATDNRPISIPYSDFNTNYCGVGIDYEFYVFNYFLANPPANTSLPQGIGNGSASNINAVISASSPEEGCYDLSIAESVFIPEPLVVTCNQSMNQGNNGGISPFYFNIYEICIEGGTQPYNYIWQTTGYVRQAIIGGGHIRIIHSEQGLWSVTVTDANGCTLDNDGNPLVFSSNNNTELLSIYNYVITPSTTVGFCENGSISIDVQGGNPDYTYNWSGPATWSGTTTNAGATVVNATTGWYAVTVTDSNENYTTGWYWVTCSTPGRGKTFDIFATSTQPNPFKESVNIGYHLAEVATVELTIFSQLGQKIHTLVQQKKQEAGTYNAQWNAHNLPKGIYYYQFKINEKHISKKIIKF